MARVAPRLILGSSSPQRIELLKMISVVPDLIKGADIDETPKPRELPASYVQRMALEKNLALINEFPNDYILTADTTVVVGTRVFGKSENNQEQEKFIRLISGRSHRVMTAVTLHAPGGKMSHRLHISRLTLKRMSEEEIKEYVECKEWEGKAGYRLAGMFSRYVSKISGSPSGIIGLPLYETMQLLNGSGYKINTGI